jgi:hypothetical protein
MRKYLRKAATSIKDAVRRHPCWQRVDIYGHWLPGEGNGKEQLNETFCGKKGRTLLLKL